MSYRGYLFDLDGTLVDTAPDLQLALNHTLAADGLGAVDLALTRHWVGHGVRAMLRAAFAHHGQTADAARLDAMQETCVDYYREHIADFSRPYAGVVETLETLGARAPLAVVTNKLASLSERLLEALALSPYFRVVVGRDTAAKPKPDAAPALFACERIGCPPGEALFVGDSQTDVDCARAAGCPVVVYRHGYNHGQAPEAMGADAVIDSFAELA